MTTISASSTIGIYLTPSSYTNPVVINPGVTISNSGNSNSGNGVLGFTGTWTIENSGGIASALGNGVYLGSGGLITNAAAASISGVDGINIGGGAGTVVNDGTIAGNTTSSIGVLLAAGGSVTNQSGGTISGYTGVDLTSGGAVTNAASAAITGVYDGVAISGRAGTVVNHGNVAGTGIGGIGVVLGSGGSITNAAGASIAGSMFGVDLSAGGTLTNAGTVIGNAGTAVYLGGASSNLLVLDPGYGLSGIASGGTSAINTLELASAATTGTLSGLGTEFVNFGQITIDANASWVLSGGNTIEAGTTLTALSGAILTDSGTLVNDGTIVLDPGTLTVGGLTGTGLVTVDAGSTLVVQGTVAGGETLTLAGSGADLHLDAPGSVSGSVTQFAPGETIDLKGINPASVSYSGGLLSFSGGSFALSLANPGSVTASPSSDGAAVSVACFCAGTLIRTDRGDVAVESLAVGDRVVTASGAVRPITWIGHRHFDLARHPAPESISPIRIRAHAFADAMPRRDLLLSPDHAVLCDNALIAVRPLVNGASIVREAGCRAVTYVHLELDAHDIVLAEDLPVESYLDTGNRWMFENAGVVMPLHPDLANDMTRRIAESCLPFVCDPARIEPVWQRLARRAGQLGLRLPPAAATTSDPALCLLADGRNILPTCAADGKYVFVLPRGHGAIRLQSRSAVPGETTPWVDEWRRLGVMLRALVLRSASAVTRIPLDHPALQEGWWAPQWHAPTALYRWTNGNAVLPLPDDRTAPCLLEVDVADTVAYPLAIEQPGQRVAA